MNHSAYKDFRSSRGGFTCTYHYYFNAPTLKDGRPWLLLLHGFPSTSRDWRHQIEFFSKEGYGLIVPDMLGYGGSSKPTDPNHYKKSLICKDLVELLDSENINSVICIGHDWGSLVAGRLANFYPERFLAFAFLAVGYNPPTFGPQPKFEDLLAVTKKMAGYELFGYWGFFSEADAAKLIEEHMDGFLSFMYAEDSKIFIEHFCPSGAFRSWLLRNETCSMGSYVSKEDVAVQKEILLHGSMIGPLCWYQTTTSSIDHEDNQTIPKDNVIIEKPVFFGAALKDYIALAAFAEMGVVKNCKNATIRNYQAAHWVMIETKDEVNKDLLNWIQGIGASKL